MHWLIEKDVFGDGMAEKFVSAISSHSDQSVKIANYVPFDENQIFDQFISDYQSVFVYGSINLMKRLQYQSNSGQFKSDLIDYTPWDMFRTSIIYNRFKGFTLSKYFSIVTVKELLENLDFYFKKFSKNLGRNCFELFAKSDEGDKRFYGSLYNIFTLEETIKNNLNCNYITPEDLIIVAQPSKIDSEYRVVISDGYVTGSRYLDNRNLIKDPNDFLPQKIKRFVKDVLSQTKYNPAPMWVLDIGETIDENGKEILKVIETGSINMCGLYGCNIQKIVNKLIDLKGK